MVEPATFYELPYAKNPFQEESRYQILKNMDF